MITTTLNKLILTKSNRQRELEDKKEEMGNISLKVYGSKFQRRFSTLLYSFKRFFSIAFASIFLLLSVTLLVYPKAIFSIIPKIKTELNQKIQDEYHKNLGEMISKTYDSTPEYSDTSKFKETLKARLGNFVKLYESAIEDEFLASTREKALLILGFSFFLFYIARQTKEIHIRNKLISDRDDILKGIIADYTHTIAEESEELEQLKQIANEQPN
ncbi:MAG: hypothetical protein ACI93S_001553 [Ancylomarina sp.]|jgi:hypothetical protein